MPDRSGFPGTAAVHYDDGGGVKTGVRIRTECMSEMVIDKTEARITTRKFPRKPFRTPSLVPHADEMHRGGDEIEASEGHYAGSHAFQVVAETWARGLPAKADFVQLIWTDAREIEAGLYGIPGEAAVLLHTAEALFGDGEEKLSITDDASGRIMRTSIVKPQGNHMNGTEVTASRCLPHALIAI